MNSNDVFFFGSGFSKSLIEDYPTLRGLSNFIDKSLKKEENSISKHYIDDVPEIFHNDIENLLTYLSTNLPYKSPVQKSLDEALYTDITSKLANKFKNLIKNKKIDMCDENKKIFADYICTNNCTCITLNYDLLLEEILYKNFFKENEYSTNNYSVFYKFPIIELKSRCGNTSYNWVSDEEGIMPEIIKLHGSRNWLYAGLSDIDPIYLEEGNEEEYLKADLVPFIIPPVLDKQNQYNNAILKLLWNKAFKVIEEATNIYIYGFSFPTTDYSIKFLFQSALEQNKNDYKIHVINTSEAKDELKKHYEKIFGKNKCDFSCCVENNQLEALLKTIKKDT